MDEAVVGDAARLDARGLALGVHRVERGAVDLKRDVQVEVVLLLELERPVRRLEEGEEGAVGHLVEGVQHLGLAAGHRRADLEGVGQRQAEEVLVEAAGLLGIAAAVGVVVQALDADGLGGHGVLP